MKCGTFGEFGCLSFNGNKVITTSGGGALICRTKEEADRAKFYATQARENRPYYYHEVIGYNYRMSNICAGIGCGQMDVLADHVELRRNIHRFYTEALAGGCNGSAESVGRFRFEFLVDNHTNRPCYG